MTEVDLPLVHEYVAPAESPGDLDPAVVVLHGRGANERDLLPIVSEFPDGLAAVSLRAPEPLGPGHTWFEFEPADADPVTSQPVEADFRRSLDLVGESVDAAATAYGLDPTRVGLLGFSQGAITSFSLLLEEPTRYAWCAGLHGYLAAVHADLAPAGIEGKPVFVGAGTLDRLVPVDRAARAAERLRALGAAVTFETYHEGHGVGRAELDDLVAWVRSIVVE